MVRKPLPERHVQTIFHRNRSDECREIRLESVEFRYGFYQIFEDISAAA